MTGRSRTGVLVSNLGTPDAPTPGATRRYLREFLSDPRVVELPRWVWRPILHGIVLRLRPRRSAHAYQRVWTEQGAPLLVASLRQVDALRELLATRPGDSVTVALGMRYGKPSIAAALTELRDAGVDRVLVLPLYPQYSSATTASTFDAVVDVLKSWRRVPELRTVTSYHDQRWYVGALAASIEEAWSQDGGACQRLLFSFHGMPRRTYELGDPYYQQCQETARLVAAELGLERDRWAVSFQSRFGFAEWLQPYTDATLRQWGESGVASVDVVCPGFSADCLETLEEIAMLNRDVFLGAGGERYRYIPALNDRADHIQGLAELIERHVAGWDADDPGQREKSTE